MRVSLTTQAPEQSLADLLDARLGFKINADIPHTGNTQHAPTEKQPAAATQY